MRTSIAFLLLMPLASASILRGSEQDQGNFISRLLGGYMGAYSVSTGRGGGSGGRTVNRNDGISDLPVIIVDVSTTASPTAAPTAAPTPTPTQVPTSRPTVSAADAKTCPTLDSESFQVLPGVTKCSTNADCDGVLDITGFGPTCCIHPLCVCSAPESHNPELTCVDDTVDRTDGIGGEIDIGPVAPTEAPTNKPTKPPSPDNTCPSPQAHIYQAYPDVTPCTTNADCDGFTSPDGPTCCVHPQCICGVSNLGASGKVQCVATRRDRALFERDFGENLP